MKMAQEKLELSTDALANARRIRCCCKHHCHTTQHFALLQGVCCV
jgi:hypothetical protein